MKKESVYGVEFTEEELEEVSKLDLDENERNALFGIMFRPKSDIDESARYAGYYIQMRVFGTLAFRIIHSQPLWIESKKIFKSFGIDLNELPERTLMGNRVLAVRLFDKNYPIVTDLWEVLVGIKRKGVMKDQRLFDPTPVLG